MERAANTTIIVEGWACFPTFRTKSPRIGMQSPLVLDKQTNTKTKKQTKKQKQNQDNAMECFVLLFFLTNSARATVCLFDKKIY